MDITQRRAAQEDLLKTRADLEKSLAELRATQQQMVQTERLRAIGEMVKGIAHDFSNTLSLIVGYGEMLQRKCRQPDSARNARNTRRSSSPRRSMRRKACIAFGNFIAPSSQTKERRAFPSTESSSRPWRFPSPMGSGVERPRRAHRDQKNPGRCQPIAGNRGQLREMVVNLIFNAVDAMPQGGEISIVTKTAGDRVELIVADTGVGMTEEVRRRCIEPYFTTKGLRGMGLGLAMVYGAVERHEGTMKIESAQGRGTRLTFSFPVGSMETAEEQVRLMTQGVLRCASSW